MTEDKVYTGTVAWFSVSKGYGFITRDDGEKDCFLHYSDINNSGFKLVKAGQRVSFTIGENNAGLPKATDVTVIDTKR